MAADETWRDAGAARPRGLLGEWLLAACVALAGLSDLWRAWHLGYLPQPFFYESSDTWMDWFNTAWWAHDRGIYDSWASIYPPLSFVILKVLGLPQCYRGPLPGPELRLCDWLGVGAIHALYLLDAVLVAWAFVRMDRRTALPRAFALVAGMPLLYGLERGNLVLLAFACMVLAFGRVLRSARLRWLALAVMINLKVYLISALAAQLLRRRWRWFEGGLLVTVLVYLASYLLLGIGTPGEVVANVLAFARGGNAAGVLDVWYAASYAPLATLLASTDFPISTLIGSQIVETGGRIVAVAVHGGQAIILAGAAATWLRPGLVPPFRATLFGVALALITSEAGGYTICLILFFVMMERWEGLLCPAAITIAYLLCIPGDIVLSTIAPMVQDSFLAGHTVSVQHGIGLGMFLRPLLVILAPALLALHTVAVVWRDLRCGGGVGASTNGGRRR